MKTGLLSICACCAFSAVVIAEPLSPENMGTTIVGDEHAAIGLYLMPWREEPMGDIDRPPRLLHEPLDSVDVDDFRLVSEWRKAVRDYRWFRLQRNQ